MADKNINILLTLQSKITGDLAKVTRTLDKTKESLQSLDRIAKQSRRIAGDIAFIGTAISGVFGLSMANAGKYSLQVAQANDKLTNSYAAMQVELANALLPTYNQFINVVVSVTKYVQSLDSAFKEKLVRMLAITAIVGVAIGLFGSFIARVAGLIINIGKLIVVFGKFALIHPYIAGVIALIAVLSYITYKFATDWNDTFETKVIPVLSKTESVFTRFVAGAQRDLMNLFKTLNFMLLPTQKILELVGKVPGNKGYEELSKSIAYAREQLDLLAEASEDAMNQSLGRANEILTKNNGILATAFKSPVDGIKKIKQSIESLFSEFKKGDTLNFSNNFAINVQRMKEEMDRIRNFKLLGNEGFLRGFSTGISKSISELRNFAQLGQNIAQQTATAMSTYFSDSFFAIFTGDLSNLEEAFSNFAKSILRMISDIIAQYLTLAALSSVVGGPFTSVFSGLYGTKHTGGEVVRAHSGRAPAFDEVDLRLQTGEGVLSRKGMNNIGGKDNLKAINSGAAVNSNPQPIININLQTWDAQDIIRNKKTIVGIIANAINSNSGLRRTIQNA